MNVLDLFSGIGGFSLGLERAGMETVAFCEIDKFCQKVLKRHWPDVPIFNDVRSLDYEGRVDVICGGFPCQDISIGGAAWGVNIGIAGERSGLWRCFKSLIKKHKPEYVVIENVSALWNKGLDAVLKDLCEIGYDAEWHFIRASDVGLLQRRERIFIIAYPASKRVQRLLTSKDFSEAGQRRAGGKEDLQEIFRTPTKPGKSWPQPLVCGTHNRPSDWTHRIKALGNAVVPQIPEIIGRAIMEIEND